MSLDARPIENESQEIGRLAGRALSGCMPTNWIEQTLDGSTDFGIDYMIQFKDKTNAVQFKFYLQLKGTKSPSKLADGTAISFQFNVSTLNYYRNSESAIMVALADLSVSDRIVDCPVYYLWIDEYFLDSINHKLEENDKVSIHIPLRQIIDNTLDVSNYYQGRLKEREELHNFSKTLLKHSKSHIADIAVFTKAIENKPIILDSLKDDGGTPWMINPEGHNTTELKNIHDLIKNNQINSAKSAIEKIIGKTKLTDHEKAELYTLQSSIATLEGNNEQACELANQAKEIYNNKRYLLNWVNNKIMLNDITQAQLEEFVDNLNPNDFRECFTIAKCLCLLHRGNEAIQLLSDNHPKQVIGIWIIALFSGDKDKASEIEKNINVGELPAKWLYIYHTFLARELFDEGTKRRETDDKIIPISGQSDFDFNKLRTALEYAEYAWINAEEVGFPQEIVLLLDISVLLYSMFGKENDLISVYEKLFKQRSKNTYLAKVLAHLYFNKRDYRNVIEKLEAIDFYKDSESLALYISSKIFAKEKKEAVKLLKRYQSYILSSKPQNYKQLFIAGAQAAHELLDDETENEFLQLVRSIDEGNSLLALYEYFRDAKKKPKEITDLNARLFSIYKENGKPHIIATQLFPNLKSNNETEAKWIIEISDDLLRKRELFDGECLHLAYALVKLRCWEDLELLADKVIQRKGESHTWILMKVAGVYEQGRINEALELLDSPVKAEKSSIERAERFIGFCLSSSLYEAAESKLNQLLEKSVDSPKKHLRTLASLIHIYSSTDKDNDKLFNAIKRFGECVDRDNEEEEGQYLNYLLLLTNRDNFDRNDLLDDYQDRSNNFFQKFPNSKFLRLGEIPETASGTEILNILRELVGTTEEQIQAWKKNRNLLRAQRINIPYSMIHRLIDNTQDVFGTWVMGLYHADDHAEYFFRHSQRKGISVIPGNKQNKTLSIFIEELSLIVLSELDILEYILINFDIIYISRNSYDLIARKSHAIFGSVYSRIPLKIIESLNKYLDKIILTGESDNELYTEYNKTLIQKLPCQIILSDDANYEFFFGSFSKKETAFINSFDIIDFLLSIGVIQNSQKILLIESFCKFPVLLPTLKFSELSLSAHSHAVESEDLLTTNFKSIFNRCFSTKIGSIDAFKNFSSFLSQFIIDLNAPTSIIPMQNLTRTFLVRHAEMDRLTSLSFIFVLTSIIMPEKMESEFIHRSQHHSFLFDMIYNIAMDGEFLDIKSRLFRRTSEVITNMSPMISSEIYPRVKSAFTEYSADFDLFRGIYDDVAIRARMQQDTPLQQLLDGVDFNSLM